MDFRDLSESRNFCPTTQSHGKHCFCRSHVSIASPNCSHPPWWGLLQTLTVTWDGLPHWLGEDNLPDYLPLSTCRTGTPQHPCKISSVGWPREKTMSLIHVGTTALQPLQCKPSQNQRGAWGLVINIYFPPVYPHYESCLILLFSPGIDMSGSCVHYFMKQVVKAQTWGRKTRRGKNSELGLSNNAYRVESNDLHLHPKSLHLECLDAPSCYKASPIKPVARDAGWVAVR